MKHKEITEYRLLSEPRSQVAFSPMQCESKRGGIRPLTGTVSKRLIGWIGLSCIGAIFFVVVAVATGKSGGSNGNQAGLNSVEPRLSTHERVLRGESLPCTGLEEPINFQVFSAGPSVAGIPLRSVQRRCGGSTPKAEPPANFTNYIYGRCEIAAGATGCAPPLEIQTWPACQRALGDYKFEGQPVPYRRLPNRRGAEVVEINFMIDRRIEVYSKSSTVVIFAENPAVAAKALDLLRAQEKGQPPATRPPELGGAPEEGLEPPTNGATEGALSCQS